VKPEIQYFAESGTWVKPVAAVAVDVMLCAAAGGLALGYGGGKYMIGTDGELTVRRFPAGELPAEVTVTVGKGGRPGGRDGYALIITHLASPPLPSVPAHDLMLHAHSRFPDDDEPHEHLHTGPGHGGIEHSHPHRHASPEDTAALRAAEGEPPPSPDPGAPMTGPGGRWRPVSELFERDARDAETMRQWLEDGGFERR
jgi:hypothetical protein